MIRILFVIFLLMLNVVYGKTVSIKSYGADNQGLKDSSIAIQNAINELPNGGIVFFPQGTYIISKTLVIHSKITLKGEGSSLSILKLNDKSSVSMIRSKDFLKLRNTNTWLVEKGMIHSISLIGLQIDGNKNKQTKQCNGVELYAKRLIIKDVIIRDINGDGWYSEGADKPGQRDWKDLPESYIENLRIRNCNGNGFVFKGPHDAVIETLYVNECKGNGVMILRKKNIYSGICDINLIHTYANKINGFISNTTFTANLIIAENNKKNGFEISGWNALISKLLVYDNRKKEINIKKSAKYNLFNLVSAKQKQISATTPISIYGEGNVINILKIKNINNIILRNNNYINMKLNTRTAKLFFKK